jgi:uncharacterized protein YlzI (FlbEa/FlbD family)
MTENKWKELRCGNQNEAKAAWTGLCPNSLTTLSNSKCYIAPNSTLAVVHKLERVCKEAVIACLKEFVRRDYGKVYITSYKRDSSSLRLPNTNENYATVMLHKSY